MKKLSKSLLLAALLMGMHLPAWGQTSTEGKEFWITLLQAASPEGDPFEPYLAISTKKESKITVSNPRTGWSYQENNLDTITIPANSWKEIKIQGNDLQQWYNASTNTVTDAGVKVTSTEEVSVFVASRLAYSFDASNIIPINALQAEYIVQDYPPYNHQSGKESHGNFAILATGTNINGKYTGAETTVNIDLYNNGTFSRTISDVKLKPGQAYFIKGGDRVSLSGSHIKSNDMKIAVFNGVDITDVPGPFSARDNLYEQAMPIDYWGTEFIVTRSIQRDANRIRITAQENGTQIYVDGKNQAIATINANQTYELELSEDGWGVDGYRKKIADANLVFPDTCLPEKAHYIRTSCPCAVYSYDVSNNYQYGKDSKSTITSEQPADEFGDPSMVWISPLQQNIKKITFGVMGTDKTHDHYLNVVTLKSNVSSMKLIDEKNNNIITAADFSPVPGKTDYCYMRKKIAVTETGQKNPTFTLEGDAGFIAHVYGHGEKESYAYSAGSSAVKRAISVNGDMFTDNMIVDDILKQTYCADKPIHFDPQIGADIIDKVVWDFGDGTTVTTFKEDQIAVDHTYSATGWYDVVALVSAHRDCPYSSYPEEPISFTIRVVRQDTVFAGASHDCIDADVYANSTGRERDSLDNLLQHGTIVPVPTGEDNCWDPVYLYQVAYGLHTKTDSTLIQYDSAFVFGKWYKTSQTIYDTIPNSWNCKNAITCELIIKKCLHLSIINEPAKQHICQGQNYDINYSIDPDGLAGDVYLVFMGDTTKLNISLFDPTGTITVPTDKWPVGRYQAKILVQDLNCNTTAESDVLDFEVYYPEDIFAYKFNNVLAVYKKGYGANTGYTFTDYQWYLNGEKIENATSSVYHTDEPFTIGDSYYVELTRNDGLKIRSCEKIIEGVVINNSPAAPAPAQKLIRNQRFYILKEGMVYDMYGQRVE